MLLSGRGQLTGPKQAIKMGDYVIIEEVVSTRCLGVQIDKALKLDHRSCIGANEVVYAEVELT